MRTSTWMILSCALALAACEQESDSTLSAAVAVAASPSKAKDGRREGGGDCDTAATFARACRAGRWQIEFQCLEMLLMIMSLSRGGTPPPSGTTFLPIRGI